MAKNDKITATLPNGLTLTGKREDVYEFLHNHPVNTAHLDETHHFSETNGKWIPLSEMDSRYIKNVIFKKIKEHLNHIGRMVTQVGDGEFVALVDEITDGGEHLDLTKYYDELLNRSEDKITNGDTNAVDYSSWRQSWQANYK